MDDATYTDTNGAEHPAKILERCGDGTLYLEVPALSGQGKHGAQVFRTYARLVPHDAVRDRTTVCCARIAPEPEPEPEPESAPPKRAKRARPSRVTGGDS